MLQPESYFKSLVHVKSSITQRLEWQNCFKSWGTWRIRIQISKLFFFPCSDMASNARFILQDVSPDIAVADGFWKSATKTNQCTLL